MWLKIVAASSIETCELWRSRKNYKKRKSTRKKKKTTESTGLFHAMIIRLKYFLPLFLHGI